MKRVTASTKQASSGWTKTWLGWVVWAAAIGAPACSSSVATPAEASCSLNSDCAMGLICALGKCRSQCVNASDCPVSGSSCIDDGRNPVCQTPTEKNTPCTKESDCATPLACASDYRCRNLCLSDAECNVLGITGRICAKDSNGVDYCGDPGEVSNGVLVAKPPAGALTSTPVAEPEGGASAIVAALPQGPIIATIIGTSGGVLGADGVTVSIPAGALSQGVPVTIQLSAAPGPNGTVSQVFEIGPTGTTFAQPITIAFDYTDSQLGGLPPSNFAVETSAAESGAMWTPLSQIVVDVYAHTIAGQTTHLSPYALVQQGVSGSSSDDASATVTGDAGSGGAFVDGSVAVTDAGERAGSSPDAGVASQDSGLGTNACAGRAPNVSSPTGTFTMGAGTLPSAPGGWSTGDSPAVNFSTLVDGYAEQSVVGSVNELFLGLTPYTMACGHLATGVYEIGAAAAFLSIQSCTPFTTGTYGTLQVYAGVDGVPSSTPAGVCPGGGGSGTGGGPCSIPTSATALTITAIDTQHVAGNFNIPQGDAGAALTGTFDVPFCAPSGVLTECCLPGLPQ